MTGAAPGELTLAQEVIDFAEIHVLDVQPLTAWQRWVIERMFPEMPGGE